MVINGVSIVIPTYNRLATLEESIKSIIKQTYTNWELVIVEDNSPRDSRPLVEEFMKKDERVKYYRNDVRKGPSGARNVGISKSKFDHILFIDDDVILKPGVLEILVNDFNKLSEMGKNMGAITPASINIDMEDLDLVRNGIDVKDKNIKPYLGVYEIKRSKYTGMIFDNFSPKDEALHEVSHVHACSLFSKKSLIDAGEYDEKLFKGNYLYEDADLAYRVWKKGYALYFEPKAVLYHVRVTEGGCRVDNKYKNVYFFILNWVKYLIKNYGWRSVYMIPFFALFLVFRGTAKSGEMIKSLNRIF